MLVADDDATFRSACADMLRRAGFAVREAGDGEQAWDPLLSGTSHLVITDHLTPKASGLALVRRMRVAGMDQPVILAADTSQFEFDALGPWERIDGIVFKPFSLHELMNCVEEALQPDSRNPFELALLEELHHPA